MAPRTVLALSILALASCAHPNRVSRGLLRQLARKHEPYVLVFGSLTMPVDSTAHPSIRFVHQSNRAAPEYLLQEVTVAGNHRFYAILNKPAAIAVLDEFEAAVGSANTAWDKITYVRLHPGDGPLAFYVGEITVIPPPARNVPGQTMTVAIRDDFQNAAQELGRLYPEFTGATTKAPLLRAPVPVPAPPRLK
jgi:hypothetical protein